MNFSTFLVENWKLLVEGVLLVVSFILLLIKKKPVKVYDSWLTIIRGLLPEFINRVENYKDIFNPESNIKAGSAYYGNLKKVLGNKDLYAISAYNGGIGSVNTWLSKIIYNDTDEFVEQIPYLETRNYVKKVLRSYWVYGNVY